MSFPTEPRRDSFTGRFSPKPKPAPPASDPDPAPEPPAETLGTLAAAVGDLQTGLAALASHVPDLAGTVEPVEVPEPVAPEPPAVAPVAPTPPASTPGGSPVEPLQVLNSQTADQLFVLLTGPPHFVQQALANAPDAIAVGAVGLGIDPSGMDGPDRDRLADRLAAGLMVSMAPRLNGLGPVQRGSVSDMAAALARAAVPLAAHKAEAQRQAKAEAQARRAAEADALARQDEQDRRFLDILAVVNSAESKQWLATYPARAAGRPVAYLPGAGAAEVAPPPPPPVKVPTPASM